MDGGAAIRWLALLAAAGAADVPEASWVAVCMCGVCVCEVFVYVCGRPEGQLRLKLLLAT